MGEKKTLNFTSFGRLISSHQINIEVSMILTWEGQEKKKSDWYLCWTSLQSQGNYCKI